MLNGTHRRADGSLLIQILFLLAIGPARKARLKRLLGQRVAAARPYDRYSSDPLYFRPSLAAITGEDFRFDNFAADGFRALLRAESVFNGLFFRRDNFLSSYLS